MSPQRAPTTIDDVIARMRAVDAQLPTQDGVAWFNKLYLRVTERVSEELRDSEFRDPRFLERLDVRFAALYFRALDASAAGAGAVPKAWAPLFEARARRTIAPIQFALAGMNAHINYDLPVALVDTCRSLRLELRRRTPHFADFTRVNALLGRVEGEVKEWFATGFVAELDRAFGRADDVVAMWKVERARDHAWTAAQTVDALRGPLRRDFLLALGRMVGLAGRGLLVDTATR